MKKILSLALALMMLLALGACGGKGGGRPDMAMAGGKDLTKVDDAINSVDEILAAMIA